ncbi:MAG: hypothetical protein ABIA04_11900 [Pseudomonadota bacterium]
MKNISFLVALSWLYLLSTIGCGPTAARNASEFKNPLDELFDKWGQCTEVSPTATDPYCIDSDGDGIPDLVELEMGTDPDDGDMTQEEFCLNAMQTGSEYAEQFCEAMGLGNGFGDMLDQAAAGDGFNAELLISILQLTGDALTQILTAFAEAGKTSNPYMGSAPTGYNTRDSEKTDKTNELLEELLSTMDEQPSNLGQASPSTISRSHNEYSYYYIGKAPRRTWTKNEVRSQNASQWQFAEPTSSTSYINIVSTESKYEYVIASNYSPTEGLSYDFGSITDACGNIGCGLIFTPYATSQNYFNAMTIHSYSSCKIVDNGDKTYDDIKKNTPGAIGLFYLCYDPITGEDTGYIDSDDNECEVYLRKTLVDCNTESSSS